MWKRLAGTRLGSDTELTDVVSSCLTELDWNINKRYKDVINVYILEVRMHKNVLTKTLFTIYPTNMKSRGIGPVAGRVLILSGLVLIMQSRVMIVSWYGWVKMKEN